MKIFQSQTMIEVVIRGYGYLRVTTVNVHFTVPTPKVGNCYG